MKFADIKKKSEDLHTKLQQELKNLVPAAEKAIQQDIEDILAKLPKEWVAIKLEVELETTDCEECGPGKLVYASLSLKDSDDWDDLAYAKFPACDKLIDDIEENVLSELLKKRSFSAKR